MGKEKSEKKIISIIVPVYNAEKTIGQCIESILNQNNAVTEIILIDDYSVDNSLSICQRYAEQNEQIKCVQTNGKGASAARNTGLELATGDFIGFCDADDSFAAETLERVEKIFCTYADIDIVITGYTRINGQNQILYCCQQSGMWSFEKLSKHVLYDDMIMGSVWNKFFRRELLKGIRFNTCLEYCEDMHFVMRVLTENKKGNALILDYNGYNYIISPESVTGNSSPDKLFNKEGTLKYAVSLKTILNDCNLGIWLRTIVGKKVFEIAFDTRNNFELNSEQQKNIKQLLKHNIVFYIMHPMLGGVKRNLFRLRKLMQKGI